MSDPDEWEDYFNRLLAASVIVALGVLLLRYWLPRASAEIARFYP